MKKIYPVTLIAVAAVFLAIFFVFLPKKSNIGEGPTPTSQPLTTAVLTLETQTNGDGPVTVKATPKLSSEIVFEITLDTHSGELDNDLTQSATLIGDNGKEYKPVRWEGDPPGGHHREGILAFSSIVPMPKTLRLIIRQIGGVPERQFMWITNP